MGFDPDKYIEKHAGFDPDKYLEKHSEGYDYSDLGQVASDLVKVNVDALPVYGQAAGSLLGPVGAGAGQAAGDSLKKTLYGLHDLVTGKRSLEDEFRLPTSDEVVDVANNSMKNFNQGVVADMGGKLAGKGMAAAAETKAGQAVIRAGDKVVDKVNGGFKTIANAIRPAEQKLNSAEIIKAAEAMGIEVTPGMLDKSEFVERLENSLAKSHSFLGQSVAKRQQAIGEALKKTVSELTEEASELTPLQLGEKVQEGMAQSVRDKVAPISEVFDDVRASTQNIPVGEKPVAAVVRNIENIPAYRLTEGAGKPGKYVEMIRRAENADDIKTVMTMLNGDINNPSIDSAEKFVLSQMKEKLARLESNSVVRGAIAAAKESGGAVRTKTGEKVAKQLIQDLSGARTGYRQLSKDLTEIAQGAKIDKNVNPSGFISKVESLQPEEVSKKFFKENNQKLLNSLEKQFPEQFHLLRQGKISEILDAATDTTLNGQGNVSAQRFLNAVKKINPEGQATIFGKEGVEKIGNLRTIQQSIPRNFNPSGTASAAGWQDALWQNVKDVPTYLLYKGASNNLANNVRSNLMKLPNAIEFSKADPKAFSALVEKIVSVAGVEATKDDKKQDPPKGPFKFENKLGDNVAKGPEKWMKDGARNLASDLPPEKINELSQSKRGQQLLIEASDLKPGTKAFENLVKKIKGGQ